MASGPGYPNAREGFAGQGDEALQRAMLALDRDRPQEAERIAGELLKADPRHARALYVCGCARVMQGRAAEAIAPLEAAARGRHDPEIDTMLAIAFRRLGRDDDALRRLKLATKRRPPYAAAFHELGSVLVSLGRDQEAIEAFRRGLKVAPMMPALSVHLGQIFLRQRNCADARAAFARALEISPGLPDAQFGLAKAYQEVGESAAAADCFRRYLVGRPRDQEAWLLLGHCLLELGQLDAGYDCFRAVAHGSAKGYGRALTSLSAACRGRFWLKPSDGERFLRSRKS